MPVRRAAFQNKDASSAQATGSLVWFGMAGLLVALAIVVGAVVPIRAALATAFVGPRTRRLRPSRQPARHLDRPMRSRPRPAAPAPVPPPVESPAPTTEHRASSTACEIRWFRGYVKSQFYAELRDGPSREPNALASSQWFKWREGAAPPPDPEIVAVRDELLKVLRVAGWQPCGRGAEWYSDRLEKGIPG